MQKEIKLWAHQEKFLNNPNDFAILCWETGCAKTFTSKLWLKQNGRDKNPVVICPKQIRANWKEDCPLATVLSFATVESSASVSMKALIATRF